MDRIPASAFNPAARDSATLDDDEIHVWRLVLDGAPTPREVTARARTALGSLLAHYGGLDRPPEIAHGEHGKPHAPSLPQIDFNLSHARDHVLLAFARNQPLGVDLERIDRRLALDDLARRFFAAEEADALERVPEPKRLAAFLRVWTCKEAVLKAIGAGLSFGLDRVVFALGDAGTPSVLSRIAADGGDSATWRIALLEPAAGFVGALAWHGPPRRILTLALDADA